MWSAENEITIEIRLVDGVVIDEYDEANPAIQKLAHAVNKFPNQKAVLVIEFKVQGYYERDWPGWTPSRQDAEWEPKSVYMISDRSSDASIRIRPSMIQELFDVYFETIKEVDLDIPNDDPDNIDDYYRRDESIQKLAHTITEGDTNPVKYTFSLDLYVEDGIVYDSRGETNEDIQKLAHTITKFPEQKALLTIELEAWLDDSDRGIDSIDITTAFIAPAGQLINGDLVPSKTKIKVRPSIVSNITNRYDERIRDEIINTPRGWTSIEADDFDENVQKLADVITEDPDIFTKG